MEKADAIPGAGDGVENHESFTKHGTNASGRNPRSGAFRWLGVAEAAGWIPTLSDGAKHALFQLATIADVDTGEVTISNDRLALRLGGSDKPVKTRQRRARERTSELRKADLLVLVRAGTGGRGRTDLVNVWRISEVGLGAVPELPERAAEYRQGFVLKGGGISHKRAAESRHLPTHTPSRTSRGRERDKVDDGTEKLRNLGLWTDADDLAQRDGKVVD